MQCKTWEKYGLPVVFQGEMWKSIISTKENRWIELLSKQWSMREKIKRRKTKPVRNKIMRRDAWIEN